MNYDELLVAKQGRESNKSRIPFGVFYRKQVDSKYVNVVDLDTRFVDSILFTEALKRECDENLSVRHPRQLHFEVIADSGGVFGYRIESGHYQSLSQLLHDNPSVIADSNWVEHVIVGLLELADELHKKDIFHVCYSPSNVFVRSSDREVMLMNHGSYYLSCDVSMLYQGCEDYLAPEFVNNDSVDCRCDVYSIGKLIEFLYIHSSLPYEWRAVVKKATANNPADRYTSAGEMLDAIKLRRKIKHTAVLAGCALCVALICVGLFFSLMPDIQNVEFVKPASDQKIPVDEYGEELLPEELGLVAGDTLQVINGDSVTVVEIPADVNQRMKQYEAKAEQIFRKQYEKEADRILSKIYNKEHMNDNEKAFMVQSKAVSEELAAMQTKMAEHSGLSKEASQRIAAEIVDKVTKRKQAAIRPVKGVQK